MATASLLDRAAAAGVTATALATVAVVVRDGRRRTQRRVLSWDEVLAQLEMTPEPWQQWWLETFLDSRRLVRATRDRRYFPWGRWAR